MKIQAAAQTILLTSDNPIMATTSRPTVKSIISYGSDGISVDIECHVSNSLPNIVIVGAANRNVDEAKERIRAAFSNSGLDMPRKRISINLAPADVPKDSSSLDLPIAIAILAVSGRVDMVAHRDEVFIGELGLDGTIRPVRGIIGKLLHGRKQGFKRYYIPSGNMLQAKIIPGIQLVPVERLQDVYAHLAGTAHIRSVNTGKGSHAIPSIRTTGVEIGDIVGQIQAKRALEIAAAGGHNVLLSGPPGTGKSMLAKALASLLPAMSHEEMLEVTHLHSLSNRDYDKLITERPVRAPHHSASHVAIVGGGNVVRPGEISLAHRGVLFFDELPEFARDTIEALRQPLEDRSITVARAKESADYPANFIFVATANPCPCGFYGTKASLNALDNVVKRCECPAHIINQYRRKLSGPLLDRIDICVNVEHIDHGKLLSSASDEKANASIKRLVANARLIQSKRFKNQQYLNSDMDNRQIKLYSQLNPNAKSLLDLASKQFGLSARAYMRSLRVARTIADLAESPCIEHIHVSEALQFRTQSAL